MNFKKYKFIIILFLCAFLVRFIYILLVDTPIISDFKVMYDAALEIINGISDYKNTTYFNLWGYQMGHVLYQAFLLKILNSVMFLKIINVIISSLTVVFIYLICSKLVSSKASKIISIMYIFFPFHVFMNSVLSNQELPILLILIAIYIFVNILYDHFILKAIGIGFLLGISNILRCETIVIIIALGLFSIFLFKKYRFKVITSFFIIVFIYFLTFNGASMILKKTKISPSGLDNNNPAWKFVLGFNYDTNGMYSLSDASIYSNDFDSSKKEAINRIKDFKKIPMLFLKKAKILWFNSDLYWPIGHIDNSAFYKIANSINQVYIYIILLLSFIGLKDLFNNKYQLLFFLILWCYFNVYLLIEIMPRYAYSIQVFLFITSSFGIDFILRKKKTS